MWKKIIILLSIAVIVTIMLYPLNNLNILDSIHTAQVESLSNNIVKLEKPRVGLLNIGHAVFGFTSDSFQCDHFFNVMGEVPEWHISFMYNSFGNNFKCLKRFMDDARARTVQVHLINEVSQRNGTGQGFEFTNGYSVSEYDSLWAKNDKVILAKFFEYVKPLQLLLEKYLPTRPNIQCIIGPGLESNVGTEAAENMVDAARIAFPYCKISWNGMKSTAWNADVIEDHSADNPGARPPCMINLDGEDIDFPERKSPALTDGNAWTNAVSVTTLRTLAEKYANRCELYFLWTWESNCSTTGVKRNPDQRKRDCSASQVTLVTELMANEIVWLNNNGKINPEVYNWTYDELLPLNLCDKVYKKVKKIRYQSLKGEVVFSPDINITEAYVMYKNNLIDVYTFNRLNTINGKQIWRSKLSPKRRYPYKTILFAKTSEIDPITQESVFKNSCWKINTPF